VGGCAWCEEWRWEVAWCEEWRWEGVHGVRGWRWRCGWMLGIEVSIIQIYPTSYSLRVPTPPAHRMAQDLGIGNIVYCGGFTPFTSIMLLSYCI